MLAEDMSRREVAQRTGRGLGTVSRVGAESMTGESQSRLRRVKRAYRCPGCGFKIHLKPCLICASGGAEDVLADARRCA